MENLNIILFISIITPLCMILFVFKNQTKRVVSFLMLGIVMCLLSSEVSAIIMNSFKLDTYYTIINITPVVEEILKACPILVFAFLYKPSKQELLECSLVVGIGFAILENAYILASSIQNISIGLALIRGFGTGMMHGICTLAVGYGMSFVNEDKRLAFTGTFSLLTVSIIYHSMYNTLVQSNYAMCGFLLPLITFIILIQIIKRRKVEVENSSIN